MVQPNPVPVFGAQKNTSTIWRKSFAEISVSAQITITRFSQYWVVLAREPTSFWRENVIIYFEV